MSVSSLSSMVLEKSTIFRGKYSFKIDNLNESTVRESVKKVDFFRDMSPKLFLRRGGGCNALLLI